jgi:hypothetical protein
MHGPIPAKMVLEIKHSCGDQIEPGRTVHSANVVERVLLLIPIPVLHRCWP